MASDRFEQAKADLFQSYDAMAAAFRCSFGDQFDEMIDAERRMWEALFHERPTASEQFIIRIERQAMLNQANADGELASCALERDIMRELEGEN